MTSKVDLFLELAQPDGQGFSRRVLVTEFAGEYARLTLGNGGSWCRRDSTLAKKYNVVRHKERGRICAIELQGYNKNPVNRPIAEPLAQIIKQKRCVILNTSNPEVDHKDGRLDDPRLSDTKQQVLDDFQPLSKAANNAKRQHCKTCRETGQRFDATRLGYPIAQYKGDGTYHGTCIGCFWHDPIAFRKTLSN